MAYYEWGRVLKIEPTSVDPYDGSVNEGFIVSIRPLGQLRSPDERGHVLGRTLWQRLTRRPIVDRPAADEPARKAFVNGAQLERLPRSLAPGEVVMMVFGHQGGLTNLNFGHDHAHVERCVVRPGSCRSIALWTDSREAAARPGGLST